MSDLDPVSDRTETALTGPSPEAPRRLSPFVKPLLWLHRLVSRDPNQQRDWRQRIEAIEHQAAIDAESSTEGKALLADRGTWQQIRATSLIGTAGLMSLGSVWVYELLNAYAVGHGFGWLAASAYLLPIPVAWKVGRRLWEQSALEGMKELGSHPTPARQLRALSTGMVRGMTTGAAMGFTLVFSQALISWFMTPAPTLGMELVIDLFHGSLGASVGAVAGAIFGPLASRPAPGASLRAAPPVPSLPEP